MSTSPLDWLQKSEDRRDKIMSAVEDEERRLGRELKAVERLQIENQFPFVEQPRGVAVA